MICDICGRQDTECRIRTIKGLNLCPKHITQYYRYGNFNDNTIYLPNEYVIYEDYAEIILKDKNCNECGRAIIDLSDVEKCKQYKWHMRKSKGNTCYVIASVKGQHNKKIHLHRFIMNYEGNLDIDHINMNGLDNRKSNLRIVTHAENKANNNMTGIKLVPSGRYQACCCRNYKTIYIGTYDTYDEAVKARADFIANL